MESDQTFWGRLIQKRRLEQGMSQRELAKRAKVNRTTLRRIEKGTARGDMETMQRVAGTLGYEFGLIARENSLEQLREAASMETDPDRRSWLAARILMLMRAD